MVMLAYCAREADIPAATLVDATRSIGWFVKLFAVKRLTVNVAEVAPLGDASDNARSVITYVPGPHA